MSLCIIQSIVVFNLILTSVVCIILRRTGEKKTVWVALLSNVVGFILLLEDVSSKKNKVIPTEDRVFMSMFGPASPEKSHLVFRMLTKGFFVPAFDKNIFFCR